MRSFRKKPYLDVNLFTVFRGILCHIGLFGVYFGGLIVNVEVIRQLDAYLFILG